MPTARPFAYNPGAAISGTTQYGTLAVGVSPELDYPSGAGGVRWWNGPDEDLGYCIGTSVPAGDQPTPEGNNGTVQFWRTSGFNDNEFITLASIVTGQNFTGGTEAQTWLESNGYWTSFQSPLLVYLDSGNPSSYSGVGNTWFDLSGLNNNATLINTPTYSPSYDGILQFDDTSLEYSTIPDLGNLPTWTVEAWFRLTSPLTSKVTAIVTNQFDLVNKLNFSLGTNNAPSNRNLAVGFYDGSWHTTSGFVPQVNVWYQLVGTYDGSVIRQYVNGVSSGGTVNYVGTPQSGGQVRLMRRWDETLTSSNFADGDLAIVKIYSTAQSAADILSSYNSTFSRFVDPTPTPTPTNSPTPTLSLTPTLTPTQTTTPTISLSPTNTPTPSTSQTPTITPTPSTTPSGSGIVQTNLFMELDASNYVSGTWTDETGNGNNATINGATWSATDGGIFDLDGTSNTISIPNNSSLSLSTTVQKTIQVWVKFDALPNFNQQVPVFGKLSNSFGFDGYWGGLFSNGGVVRCTTNGTGTQKITDSVSTVTTNTWYLFTFMSQITATANTTKVYINTTEYISTQHGSDTYSESNPLYLGFIGTGVGSLYLNGKIGACYFYTQGLSAAEVTQNFNATKSKYGL